MTLQIEASNYSEKFFVIKKPHSQELLLNVKNNETKISSSKSKDSHVFFRCSSHGPRRWNQVFHNLYTVGRNGIIGIKGFNNSKKSYLQWGLT